MTPAEKEKLAAAEAIACIVVASSVVASSIVGFPALLILDGHLILGILDAVLEILVAVGVLVVWVKS